MSHTVWTRELRVSYLAQGVRLFGDSAKQCLQQLVLQFSCQQQQSCLHILALHILCSAVCVLCAVSVIDKKKEIEGTPSSIPFRSKLAITLVFRKLSGNCRVAGKNID